MTAPATDRRCGTCKWWEPWRGWSGWGGCVWFKAHMPAAMRAMPDMHETTGTDCSQWSDGAEALGETADD